MAGVLFLLALLPSVVLGTCTFPSHLSRRPRWESEITHERHVSNSYYNFRHNKMEAVKTANGDLQTEIWICEEERGENKFVLHRENSDEYICMQFVKISDYVVQEKHSGLYSEILASMCDDERLVENPWPLVWPELDDDYASCPMVGGYTIDIREYIHDNPLCEVKFLKPRLESECIKGEGLTIDFRHFDCKGDLTMLLVQKLSCLGTWEQGGYRFTIMTDQDDLWPKLWLLRLPRESKEVMRAVLSKDIIVDTHDYFGQDGSVPLKRLYEVLMTMEVFHNLCEDEAINCQGACGTESRIYCQKTCGLCEEVQSLKQCSFLKETQGEWMEVKTRKPKGIKVAESMLYANDLIPFQCYGLHSDLWYEGQGRKALATVFKNGCKPRYSCVEFQAHSQEVMTYRLSQSLVWPIKVDMGQHDACSDDLFVDDPKPLSDKYRSSHSKTLLRKRPNYERRKTVACNVKQSIALIGSESKKPLGVLRQGMEDTIKHETCEPNQSYVRSRTLRCIASQTYEEDSQIIMVEEEGRESNTECWVFHRNEWDVEPRVFVLPPSECYSGSSFLFGGWNEYLAIYQIKVLNSTNTSPCAMHDNADRETEAKPDKPPNDIDALEFLKAEAVQQSSAQTIFRSMTIMVLSFVLTLLLH